MAVAKIVELSASSSESFEDAVQKGIDRASETISDVKQAWIKDMKVMVENGKVTEYVVHMMITFVLHKKK